METATPHTPDERYEQISDLIVAEQWPRIAALFVDSHPADIADWIDRSPRDLHSRLFDLVAPETKPDVLAELESQAGSDVLEALTVAEISDLVEEMAPDDAADVLGDLEEERSAAVLDHMEDEEAADVRRLLAYPDDSAGGIMTTDVVSMRVDQTVQEALDAIAYMEEGEPFVFAYIVDEHGILRGQIDIWELLRTKDRQRPLKEFGHNTPVTASLFDDQEDVAHRLRQYDLSAIPVVDSTGRLVGRITVDDVIDVIAEEATEDIMLMAGTDEAELESDSALRSCMARLPWLLITLVGGFVTSLLLRAFNTHIAQIMILSAFVPVVLAMGGNTGIQASTLMVRSIALHGAPSRSLLRILGKEILTGAIMGLICGTIIGAWAHVMIGDAATAPGLHALHLAGTVGLALFLAMTFAALFGTAAPLILSRLRVDPAVAAGPFVSIANDVFALIIYFGVTSLMLAHFATVS